MYQKLGFSVDISNFLLLLTSLFRSFLQLIFCYEVILEKKCFMSILYLGRLIQKVLCKHLTFQRINQLETKTTDIPRAALWLTFLQQLQRGFSAVKFKHATILWSVNAGFDCILLNNLQFPYQIIMLIMLLWASGCKFCCNHDFYFLIFMNCTG